MMKKLFQIVSTAEFRSRSLSSDFGKGISHPLLKSYAAKDVISYALCNYVFKALWLWNRNIKTGKATKDDKTLLRTSLVYVENFVCLALECRNGSSQDIETAKYIATKVRLMRDVIDIVDVHGEIIPASAEM
jgi:hypothetical protein